MDHFAFATATRRFRPGDTVSPADFDGQMSIEDALRLKLIATPKTAPAKAEPASAE